MSKVNTPRNRAQLKQMFDNKYEISLRKASKKFKCSKSTISNTQKDEENNNRSKRLNTSPLQCLIPRPKCHNLYFKYKNYKFLIDDELTSHY